MDELRRRLQARPDSEHEQVAIRALIALLALIYLSFAGPCLPLAIAYMTGSLLLLGHLLWRPGPLPARRFAGMALDLATLTVALIMGEATAAIFYPFYLWITLGMGFRYGRSYLYVSAVLSLLSFALVVAVTPFWQDQPALAAGLWAALLMLPAYAASLLAKLTEAVDRAEAASRAKSRFLATMSHELRTPLNAIIGVTDLLRDGPLNGEQRDLIRTARVAGENLLDMINDVLDVARIESGKVTVEHVDFDLHRLLGRIRGMFMPRAASQGLYLNLIIDPSLPFQLRGGERELRQIVVNLVANGIKFTETGGVTIRVQRLDSNAERVRLRLEVEDTGVGIPRDARERIFEQFAQADQSTTRRYGGSGLGLTIARQLAGLLEGDLRLADRAERGSRFVLEAGFERGAAPYQRLDGTLIVIGSAAAAAPWCERARAFGLTAVSVTDLMAARRILLHQNRRAAVVVLDQDAGTSCAEIAPAVLRHAAGAALHCILISADGSSGRDAYGAVLDPEGGADRFFASLHAAFIDDGREEAAPLVPEHGSGGSRRILLAEDNRTNQKVIARLLERAGHAVHVVGDGAAALDALERDDFDVVLMDLNMPEMGGLEATQLYRFAEPQRERPVFVALTADVTEETRAECARAGIHEFMTKPVTAAALFETIDRVSAEGAGAGADEIADGDDKVVMHPRRASTTTAIDRHHLERLRQLDQDDGFFVTVVREFVADAEQLVAELKAAAAGGDAVMFRDRAHALRSSAAHMGALAVFDLCLGWRGISPAELAGKRKAITIRLTTEFERMRDELLAIVEEPDAPPRRSASGDAASQRPPG